MSIESFIIVFLLLGIILVFLHFATKCPPARIEYRYITPTMEERMYNAAFSNKKQFEVLFDDDGPWIKSHIDQKLR